MKARSMFLVVAGALALAPLAAMAAQDHAVPRGGGGGGGSAPSGGGQPAVHSSGGGSSSGGSSYSGGSSSSPSGHTPSVAERRHPRAGTGSGARGGYYPYGGYPYYPYYPYGYGWGSYYPGFYGSYWWPYGSWGWYGGYWGNPWGWGGGPVYHYVENESAAIRVLVDPSDARVYVDGYYAGTVDDFDGLFQRLNVAPGYHEITLKLEGYQSHRMRVYASSEGTLKLHFKMQKGTGETFEDMAANVPESVLERDRARMRGREQEQSWIERGRRDEDQPMANAGTVHLEVRPADASVYVDGAFRGTAREASSLRLPAGRHHVEVVRPGYRTVEREVEVTAGQSSELSIDLERGSI